MLEKLVLFHHAFSKLVFFLAVLVFVSGCAKKTDLNNPFTPGHDVYIAGIDNGKLVYWKNGKEVVLSDRGTAEALALVGTDIYICGEFQVGDNIIASYWKNGVKTQLGNDSGISYAHSISVIGTEVYCAGDTFGVNHSVTPLYWKNGIVHSLSAGSNGEAKGIFASQTGLVVAGHVNSPDTAVAWIDSTPKYYIVGSAEFNGLTISGVDTFYVGVNGTEAMYYKNNNYNALNANGFGLSIEVSGSDVFVAGAVVNNTTTSAAYWKNNQVNVLNNSYQYSSGFGISTTSGDIYVVGSIFDKYTYIPVYWKNGAMNKIGTDGFAYGIVISP